MKQATLISRDIEYYDSECNAISQITDIVRVEGEYYRLIFSLWEVLDKNPSIIPGSADDQVSFCLAEVTPRVTKLVTTEFEIDPVILG